ncbi:MAG: hypothetical protein EAZ95_15320 [Bacteroidetes bacterium]|nr:MAG: hypothetical protein EAZ95_15320 [Bacteroidota bacterium]
MKSLLFWHTWSRSLRLSYWLLLLCFVASVGFYITAYWVGSAWSVPVGVSTELQPNKHTIAEVNAGMFNIPIEGEIFLPEQKYQLSAQGFNFPVWFYNLFGGILAFCAVLLLSVFTRLKSLWYALGMTCFILFLSALQLDNLLVFKSGSNYLLLFTLLSYIVLTFLLQSFAKDWAWHWHFLIIGAFTAGWIAYCFHASPLRNPAVFLVNYSIVIPVLLTMIFITMTAHDIPHALYHLIVKYNKQGGSSNLGHIIFMIGLYLLHLVFYYFDVNNFLRFGLTFLDTHWLLLLGAVLGIWGYKKRESLIGFILPFEPTGAFLYVAMAIISFSTIGFAHLTSQDSLLWVFRDFTLYAYIGFGLIFLAYVLLNFSEPIRDGLEVEKVTYEGKLVSYNITRYFGFLVILMFFAADKQYMYQQILAGYYNTVGDIYYMHDQRLTAKINYQQAYSNDFLNHHANYALADIMAKEENTSEQIAFLRNALKREPLPETYLKISQVLAEKEQPFHALFALKEGLVRFPKSPILHNNLALYYKEKKVLDSAFYHLERAKLFSKDDISQNNLWAILAERKTSNPELLKLPAVQNEASNVVGRANKLALFARYGEVLNLQPLNAVGKATLDNDLNQRVAYTYNYGLNRLGENDEQVGKLLNALEKADKNGLNLWRVRFLNACYEYYRGNTDAGIQALASLPTLEKDSYHNTVLGLWLLEQKAFQLADYYFERAVALGNKHEGKFYRAIALSEMGNFAEAAVLWQELANPAPREGKKEVSKEDQALAGWAVKILQVLADDAKIEDDNDRYNFLHYKLKIAPLKALQEIYAQMTDKKLKAKAGSEMIEMLLAKRELAKAIDLATTLPEAKDLPEAIVSEINYAKLRIMATQQRFADLENELRQPKLNKQHRRHISFFRAQIAEDKKDLKTAEKYYLQATLATPYNEGVIIEVARFFQNKAQNSDKAYRVLTEAVRANANSVALLQAYCQQSLIVGLENYGDDGLEQLQKITSPEEYNAFKEVYEKEKEKIKQARLAQ